MSRTGKSVETHYRMVVTRGQDWGGWGVTAKLPAFSRGSEDFLELVMCTS